jgi:small subunit ribosomal protein S5
MGKAKAIPDAVNKGAALARKNLIRVPTKGSTIPQETSSKRGAALVLIKPAPPGTGIIAAGAIRAVLELSGLKDVVTKSLGSRNPINVVYATLDALGKLKDPAEEIALRKRYQASN